MLTCIHVVIDTTHTAADKTSGTSVDFHGTENDAMQKYSLSKYQQHQFQNLKIQSQTQIQYKLNSMVRLVLTKGWYKELF